MFLAVGKLLQAWILACCLVCVIAGMASANAVFPSPQHLDSRRVELSGAQDYLGSIGSRWLYHWAPDRFPLKVYIAPGNHIRGYKNIWHTILMNAFDEWCHAGKNKIAWRLVSCPRGADVVCRWTNHMPGTRTEQEAGDTGTLVQIDHGIGHSLILRADMKLLACLDGKPFSNEQMKKICLHEVGHAFGMQGHSPVSTDIMYPQTTWRQPAHLTARDIASIRRLYEGYGELKADSGPGRT